VGGISAEYPGFSGVGLKEAKQELYHRRLPCPVRTEQSDNLARGNAKIYISQSANLSIVLTDILETGYG
jgi:hypothetical protein